MKWQQLAIQFFLVANGNAKT